MEQALQLMTALWVITMIALGFLIQSRSHWKRRHDVDHYLMVRLGALLGTTVPTQQTIDLAAQYNAENGPMRFEFLKPEEVEQR